MEGDEFRELEDFRRLKGDVHDYFEEVGHGHRREVYQMEVREEDREDQAAHEPVSDHAHHNHKEDEDSL